jgi:isopentenyl diphosphate isomerase/L-lactate dehydrogenase-like FMN-dependent dehydrogenase
LVKIIREEMMVTLGLTGFTDVKDLDPSALILPGSSSGT